jgi:hypothetical protein
MLRRGIDEKESLVGSVLNLFIPGVACACIGRRGRAPVEFLGAVLGLAALLLLAGCGSGTEPTATPEPGPPRLDRPQAVDLAWAALEPNTSSHNRANWEVLEVRQVPGASVAAEFEGWSFSGACRGPAPPPNGAIDPSETYWYVKMQPQPATPSGPSMSPTAPPLVPEPFMTWAVFLLDDYEQVIARVLACVVY